MQIEHNVSLKNHTTFRMGPLVRYFAFIHTLSELTDALKIARQKNIPPIILGGGSNTIIKDDTELASIVLKIKIRGIDIIEDHTQYSVIEIGAGEDWDEVVAYSVTKNLRGIEALSAIPGTAGATPIQNVGAYGQEIADTLISLRAYEISSGNIRVFTKAECEFGYRESVFKNKLKNQYVILSITLKLHKDAPEIPNYPNIHKYFKEQSIEQPTLAQIREAIINIRKNKLPDPKEIASVGSFFKNPIVPKEHSKLIKTAYPDAVIFEVNDSMDKIAAGWMIDALGFKGKTFGNLMFYKHNALVLVNTGDATYQELALLVSFIQRAVYEKFKITLEQEPVVLN
ncbi:MAG: UDP-N-acetylmuramate dehydrogenase [Candidatus Paceibacterota bacterium]